MRWDRDGVALAMQWKDNRPVTIVTSIDNANGFQMIERSKQPLGKKASQTAHFNS